MGFSRQEYWSGLPCPPPEDLPHPGINLPNPGLPHLSSEPPGKGVLPGQILKPIRTRNSFLHLFHFIPSGIGMSITIICLSHHCIYIYIYILMWTIFKVFINSVTVLFLFYVLGFWLWGMWDLSSLARDRTHTPCIERQSLNLWATREVHVFTFDSTMFLTFKDS